MMLLPLLLGLLHLVRAELPWWKTGIMYQVYVRSFSDSDGDGLGDLRGVINKIPYLKEIGVGIVWLSPIFESPGKDMGYDIKDFRKIDPLFGTMKDLEELVHVVHKNGMKILLDFILNDSSDEHPWFNASRYRQDGKDDYYVWKDPKGWDGGKPIPPNNWLSYFGGGSWTYDDVRKQFYLHQFGPYQPDFNFKNRKVVDKLKDIMRFWFSKQVDGFRMDAVPFLIEDDNLRDESDLPNCHNPRPALCRDHLRTQNQPETYALLKELDNVLTEYDNSTRPRYLFLEGYASTEQVRRYIADHSTPFNFDLVKPFKQDTNATTIKHLIDNSMTNLFKDKWPNWVVGNHDNTRVGSKLGPEMIDPVNMMLLMLPGVAVTYYGEEIGMVDTFPRDDQKVDVSGNNSRDELRSPMQWNQSKNAGFSRAKRTWLPTNPNYYAVNVETERAVETSHLNWYKKMVSMRKNFIESKDLETTTYGDWVFAFKRTHNKNEYYVIVNLNNYQEEVTLNKGFKSIPQTLKVHAPTVNSGFKIGTKINSGSKIILQPRSAVGLSAERR